MLISCEKCSTTYVLDDAVIPPQGAPVQCTRCGHVFTAKHPSPPSAGAEQSGKLNTGTLIFASPSGSTSPAPSKQPAAPGAVPSQTVLFGAGGPASSAAAPSASKTVVFGGPTADAPAPAASPTRRATQPMGPGTPAGNQTRNAPPSASAAAKQTIVYGGNTPPSSGLRSETVIGAQAAKPVEPSQAPGPSKQNLLSGIAEEVPKAASVEPKSQTMMFGRASGRPLSKVMAAGSSAADARVPTESSVRVDLEGGGPVGATGDQPKAGHARPRRSDGKEATPLEASAAFERRNRTVLFAMNPSAEAEPSVRASLLDAELSTPPAGLLAGVVGAGEPRREVGLEPTPEVGEGHAPEAASAPSKRQQGAPNEPEQRARAPSEHQQVDLPPDVSQGDERSAQESQESDEDIVAAMRASANRRTTIAVIVFLLIALLIGLALAWYLFGRALVKGDAPRIEQESRAALATLRRDDEASQQAAAAQTRALLTAHPDSVVARSALVIALSFLADDASAEARRSRARQVELKARLDALAVDSSLRTNLEGQVEQHEGQARAALALSVEREAALRAEIVALDAALAAKSQAGAGAERLAALRARAVAAGVLGEVSALSLAEEFRQSAPGPDNWADLALPEYVCNGGSSFDEALKQLEAVELRDDTFLRAYVLSARIHLIQHNPEGAESQLARVLAFHPGHDSAKRLQEWIVTHARND